MIPKRFILAKSTLKSLLNLKREDEEKPDLKEEEAFPEEAERNEKNADYEKITKLFRDKQAASTESVINFVEITADKSFKQTVLDIEKL